MSEWVNRLDFRQRDVVVQMYVNGLSISAITRIYQVHHSSVRYHLKKAGVYIKGRFGTVNIQTVEKYNPSVKRDYYNTRGEKITFTGYKKTLEDFQREDPERNFPKSYKDYIQREKERNDVLYKKHGIKLSTIKLPNPDNDTDPFFKPRRHRGSSSYFGETGESDEETNPVNLGSKNSITIKRHESIPGDGESNLQRESEDELSVTF